MFLGSKSVSWRKKCFRETDVVPGSRSALWRKKEVERMLKAGMEICYKGSGDVIEVIDSRVTVYRKSISRDGVLEGIILVI